MHFHADDEPIATAGRLNAHDPRAAAEAFRSIACGDGVADEVRLSAAEQLTALR
jgi:hypothetical protein